MSKIVEGLDKILKQMPELAEQERSLAKGGGAQKGAQGANVLESGQSGRYRGIYHRLDLNYALSMYRPPGT